MKQIVLAAGLVASLSATGLRGQAPTPKPGPEHQKLNVWVGDWTYESEAQATPFGPAGKSTGKMTVRSILGGFFVELRGEETGPAGTSQWVEVDRYDALNKTYSWNGFGSDGALSPPRIRSTTRRSSTPAPLPWETSRTGSEGRLSSVRTS